MADSLLINLNAAASVAAADLLYATVDPSGTPLDKKCTVTVLATRLGLIFFTGTTSQFIRGDGSIGDIDTGLTLGGPITGGSAGRLLCETSSNNIGEVSGVTSDGTGLRLAGGTRVDMLLDTSDGAATGNITSQFAAGDNLDIGDLVYLDAAATWQLAGADSGSVYAGILGISLQSVSASAAVKVALSGSFVSASAFPTLTVGGTVFMSETDGEITQTAPSTSGSAVRVVGFAINASAISMNPSPDYFNNA